MRSSWVLSDAFLSVPSFWSSRAVSLVLVLFHPSGFDGSAVFSPSLPSTIRCARALTLSELCKPQIDRRLGRLFPSFLLCLS